MTITYNAPKTEVRYNFETGKFTIYLSDADKLNQCLDEIQSMYRYIKEGAAI